MPRQWCVLTKLSAAASRVGRVKHLFGTVKLRLTPWTLLAFFTSFSPVCSFLMSAHWDSSSHLTPSLNSLSLRALLQLISGETHCPPRSPWIIEACVWEIKASFELFIIFCSCNQFMELSRASCVTVSPFRIDCNILLIFHCSSQIKHWRKLVLLPCCSI